MQAESVHGGVRAKWPSIVTAPLGSVDMSTAPAFAGPPRFQASPPSWPKPSVGPAFPHPLRAVGRSGHSAVHCQTRLLPPGTGTSVTPVGPGSVEPQAASRSVAASAASGTAVDPRAQLRRGRLQRPEERMPVAPDDGDAFADDGRFRDGPERP
jgi:hypothetical protein